MIWLNELMQITLVICIPYVLSKLHIELMYIYNLIK